MGRQPLPICSRKVGLCTRFAGRREIKLSQPANRLQVRVAEASVEELQAVEAKKKVDWASLSYSQQYSELFDAETLDIKRPVAKPSKEAQQDESDGKQIAFSDVVATPKRNNFFGRPWNQVDGIYAVFIGAMHLLALAAPFTFSWNMVGLFFASYFVTGCLGITLSYHRQLSHRSFQTPKWLEYALAYCGVLAVQGDPLEWVSSHR